MKGYLGVIDEVIDLLIPSSQGSTAEDFNIQNDQDSLQKAALAAVISQGALHYVQIHALNHNGFLYHFEHGIQGSPALSPYEAHGRAIAVNYFVNALDHMIGSEAITAYGHAPELLRQYLENESTNPGIAAMRKPIFANG